MIHTLSHDLFDLGYDLVFSSSAENSPLHLNIVQKLYAPEAVPQAQFGDFLWLPNKMGQYTFSKTAMAGISLRQLFLQLRSNFVPMILEDEPGTDRFLLHVSLCPDRLEPGPGQNHSPFSLWVFVLLILALVLSSFLLSPHSEWVLKMLSTAFAKPPTFLF